MKGCLFFGPEESIGQIINKNGKQETTGLMSIIVELNLIGKVLSILFHHSLKTEQVMDLSMTLVKILLADNTKVRTMLYDRISMEFKERT